MNTQDDLDLLRYSELCHRIWALASQVGIDFDQLDDDEDVEGALALIAERAMESKT